MKFGFVIPVYNHGRTLENVVSKLTQYNVPIIVIDDGNDAENKAAIASTVNAHSEVVLVTHEKNSGKGKAVINGVLKANEFGLTHIFQIDSDGQHDVSAVPSFIAEAEKFPNDIICSVPEYDESVPLARKNGRKISNTFARICTWDKSIEDVMCGFRIYPVAPFVKLLCHHAIIDRRMGFDVDVLVHLMWAGVNVQWRKVGVTYPKDCISNFRMVRDNITISLTFARLSLGMIVRSPILLYRVIHNRK